MKKSASASLLILVLILTLSLGLLGTMRAQSSNQGLDTLKVGEDPRSYRLPSYPARFFKPYADIITGFSTINYVGFTSLGIAAEMRGGIQVGQSLLVGSGISFLSMYNYEIGAIIPVEIGYRTKNSSFDFVSSIGYTYLLFQSFSGFDDSSIDGRTLAIDAYWRPLISRKRLRFVLAAGGMMYDFGNVVLTRCTSCGVGTGPRFTFRLRAGLGF